MKALKFVDSAYTVEYDGHEQPTPIVHLWGRDELRQRHHVKVEGIHPYFCVPEREVLDPKTLERLENDQRVADPPIEDADPSIYGDRLVKVRTLVPWDVPKLRETFEEPHEADVPFTDRACIDMGIRQGFTIPDDGVNRRLTSEDISSVNNHDVTDIPPRICFFDIEVKQGGDGPPVVTKQGTEQARNPVTAISAFDSYTESYFIWVLVHKKWGTKDVEQARTAANDYDGRVTFELFADDGDLLSAFYRHVDEYNYDVLTGWASDSFDVPYLVNRGYELDLPTVHDLSPLGEVEQMHGEGRFINRDLDGRVLFDLMDGYEKCKRHSLDSKRLEAIAREETNIEKLDVEDIDDSWENRPSEFIEYSLRDCGALVAINNEVEIL